MSLFVIEEGMKVACYVRVSSIGQNEASQKSELKKFCANHGYEPVWYIDKSSGMNMERPEFQRLQQDIFNGEVKVVVVYKLDRLSRSLTDGLNVLSAWLEKGIRLVATSQQFDFQGSVGKLIASVLLAVGEMENETRRERQAIGIENAKQRNVYKGRKVGATKSNPERALKLRGEGKKLNEIAAIMKVSQSTVQRYLKPSNVLSSAV